MTEVAAPLVRPRGLKVAKAPFSDTVLVCGKCARKFKGAGKPVAKELKALLKDRRWGKVRVVETKCFDLCPKRRQVLASHRTLADHRLVVVEPGFSPEEALHALLGPPRDPGAGADPALSLPG
ncbi:(2Fe-2S) ferredoxin domain-containing protein [Caulobacter sp. S45]|uniref:(2Fe-2S) ferredoxin domain-containing protein n=1 Tax=Caulobacter sp. S45 TaxID=1641861 RepID=UPI001575389E|nr:(2Fe-2S) ferredoxin domain-containing protein [Caulobacter sp. S45]